MQELTGGSLTNISLYRQGFDPIEGTEKHELTLDGSFGLFKDFRVIERDGVTVGQGLLHPYEHAKEVLNLNKQDKTSVSIKSLGGVYPMIWRVTATSNPVIANMKPIELADGLSIPYESEASVKARQPVLDKPEETNMEDKVTEEKNTVEAADAIQLENEKLKERIAELEKIEASKGLTEEEANALVEAGIAKEREANARKNRYDKLTDGIMASNIKNIIHNAVFTEAKDGVIELAEGVSERTEDIVLAIVENIKQYEIKSGMPIFLTDDIKASYNALESEPNEDAEVEADVKRITERMK